MPTVKILQIFNRYLQRGGEDESVDRIGRQIAAAGFELERLEFTSQEWLERHSGPARLGKLFYNREAARRLAAAQQHFGADLWLAHNIWPSISPSLYQTARSLKVPVIQYLHNWRPLAVGGTLWINGQVPKMPVHPQYLRECLAGTWQNSRVKTSVLALAMSLPRLAGWIQSVKGWIGLSDFMRDRFVEAGWPAERTFALRHSFDIHPVSPGEDRGHYLFLGRLVEEKGIRTAVMAWHQLAREKGPRTPPLIVCGSGPLEEKIRRAAATNPAIEFRGQVGPEEKAELLKTCRGVLAPALWWEPLGLTPYEAYEFQKPVIASATGGLRETVIPDETGLLHPPGDVTALLENVLRLEASPDQAAAMGACGRQWLEKNASHALWQQQFRAIVEKTMALPVS